ncbi:MAG: polyprenyl synthetase family protein [Deltaproteobacteria bacterium]|nr:polyprenyl synthetase family protein [Deltaproteobacteria bacterium]
MSIQNNAASSAGENSIFSPLQTVNERTGNLDLVERLVQVQQWLADDLSELENCITNLQQSNKNDKDKNNIATQAALHLLGRRGKRIRPICVLVSARLANDYNEQHARDIAVASELVHAATLLHDDVIDEGTERRGALTARMVYGNSVSILAGDHLLIEALRLVRRTNKLSLLDNLFSTINEMVAAEAIQLERRGRFEPNRDAYLQVINGKTAALFRWSLAAGGTLAALDDQAVYALSQAGVALGLAFQLIDDIIDLEGNQSNTGKTALTDLREGKLTWPLILAAERDKNILNELRELMNSDELNDASRLLHIVTQAQQLGALEDTRNFAKEQALAARRALEKIPASKARDAIQVVIDAAVEREH